MNFMQDFFQCFIGSTRNVFWIEYFSQKQDFSLCRHITQRCNKSIYDCI